MRKITDIEESLTDTNHWYLPSDYKGTLVSREEAQEKMKENHPHLYAMMKRHEKQAIN